MLRRAILESWPLFLGMLLLMVSNGLMVTLVTLRATDLGFTQTEITFMQSAYPLAALFGCIAAPKIVAAVGHIRSFGALASLCSIAALVHMVTADPYSWAAMRGLAGFCFPGLYVVAESWLNGRADNHTRAALLSVYFITQTGGAALGQFLLYLPDSQGTLLFVIVSVLISLSLVPMLLSARQSQSFEEPARLSVRELFRISPLGLSVGFLNGLSQGAFYVGLGLFGIALGLPGDQVGLLVAAGTLGGMLAQFPLGALSDRIDRRLVIAGAAGLAFLASLAVGFGSEMADKTIATSGWLFAAVGLVGAFMLPLYSLGVAHCNDRLAPAQMVAASGALVLVMNFGIFLGPLAGGLSITYLGAPALFFCLAILQAATALLALYRLALGEKRAEDTGTALPVGHAATPVASRLNPEARE
ncbi:MFS transporter [Pelagibius litoralis]|uniref:MFS transporter n=1 Tax=Pelagibius litoralis TaxID=374515 RepID=A0A967EXB8_9PROT|nr:MFS transporter [Pelagibius litoralis]NIA68735.1 MFS transporter [Pelagibius litoralis]